jgi:hypothetical protein
MDGRARAGHVIEEGESHAAPAVIERSPSLLEAIAEARAESAPHRRVPLPSGRAVVVDTSEGGEVVRFESPTGQVELQVTLTPEGPRLVFRAADVELKSEGTVRGDCNRYEVRAKEEIHHTSGGALKETVNGDRVSRVRGTSASLARRTLIESKRGDVKVVANDEVQLLGEKIKLNC